MAISAAVRFLANYELAAAIRVLPRRRRKGVGDRRGPRGPSRRRDGRFRRLSTRRSGPASCAAPRRNSAPRSWRASARRRWRARTGAPRRVGARSRRTARSPRASPRAGSPIRSSWLCRDHRGLVPARRRSCLDLLRQAARWRISAPFPRKTMPSCAPLRPARPKRSPTISSPARRRRSRISARLLAALDAERRRKLYQLNARHTQVSGLRRLPPPLRAELYASEHWERERSREGALPVPLIALLPEAERRGGAPRLEGAASWKPIRNERLAYLAFLPFDAGVARGRALPSPARRRPAREEPTPL